ncbi:MAG: cobalamin biosynthesis protein, partial [Bacillota bacterium]|nr:cobalamin biosynthesis protein [Bacillota bacterium]
MNELVIIIVLAIILDIAIGDPKKLTHPVVYIGGLISKLEQILYPKDETATKISLINGGILVAIVLMITYVVTALIIYLSFQLHYWFGIGISAWIMSSTLATKSLKEAAQEIFIPLALGDLKAASQKLAYVVSRQTDDLPASEIA